MKRAIVLGKVRRKKRKNVSEHAIMKTGTELWAVNYDILEYYG